MVRTVAPRKLSPEFSRCVAAPSAVVVGGITPTPLGEGKSTTTVGLCQVRLLHQAARSCRPR